jgi:hypothetical protein
MPTEEKSARRKGKVVENCRRYETTERSLDTNLRLFMKIKAERSSGKLYSTSYNKYFFCIF